MKKVAILVSHEYFDENSQDIYAPMVQAQFNALKASMAKFELQAIAVFWQDIANDWSFFDLIIPIMAWNYPQHLGRFLDCLKEIENAGAKIANSQAIIKDNMNKSYLTRLWQNGQKVPPTIEISMSEPQKIYEIFDFFNCEEIIIKPRIGAGAWRQARLKKGVILPDLEQLPPDIALIQPFIPSVQNKGELSMLFFAGQFSHALIKVPKAGDYRSQTRYGAIETNIVPPENALKAAQDIITAYEFGDQLLYARIDMVAHENDWLLMEMELIEPYLYGPFDGADGNIFADNFAKAVLKFI